MNDYTEIKKILNTLKSEIDAHIKFKKEYDKQLAFDFSLFQFFKIGENKISQVLAFFLDEKQNHGQGNLFLDVFVKTFCDKEIDTTRSINICEKTIKYSSDYNRRLDIYIEVDDFTIAIENKIWADDQNNQLLDYATYLERVTNGNYLLLYLNPYGKDPESKSITEEQKNILIDQKKFNVISYKHDIINLINSWLVVCEADNVSHFLKEFKKYLEIKFLGKNTLNMSKELRAIIHANEREVQLLVNEYNQIENEVLIKLNTVGKELNEVNPEKDSEVEIDKAGPFNWGDTRVYKYSISKNGNKIWVQFVKRGIHLYSNYYLEKDTNERFKEILIDLHINKDFEIDYNQKKSELISIFLTQVEIANQSFRIYDKETNTGSDSVDRLNIEGEL